jgi:hypothetical protein
MPLSKVREEKGLEDTIRPVAIVVFGIDMSQN